MHKKLNMPIIDAHAHIMNTERTKSGMRWIKTFVPEAESDLELDDVKALQMITDVGIDYYFNFFFPIFKGTTSEINRWNYELSLKDPRCIPFVSLLPDDKNKTIILDEAFLKYGFLGLKLHPYIQNISVADPRLYEVYDYMQETKRPVIIHTGYEHVYRVPSNKKEIKKLIKAYPGMNIIVPHLCYPDLDYGFYLMEEYPHIYLDATNVTWEIKLGPRLETYWEKIEKYSERIILGTDFTMGMAFPESIYGHFAEIPLSEKAKRDLLYRTAVKLAGQCGRKLAIAE